MMAFILRNGHSLQYFIPFPVPLIPIGDSALRFRIGCFAIITRKSEQEKTLPTPNMIKYYSIRETESLFGSHPLPVQASASLPLSLS